MGQKITGQLVDGKLIKRLVLVEGLDHPLAVRPNGTRQIYLVTIGIGIAREVEPTPGHVLPVVGRSKQAVDERLKRARRLVGEKGADLGRFRRQASEVEGNATNQIGPIGFRLLLQPFFGQSSHNEAVDGILKSGRLGQIFWRIGSDRRLEGPMLLDIAIRPNSTFADPAGEAGNFGRCQSRTLGRHDLIWIGGGDATDEFAGLGFSHLEDHLARFGRLKGRRSRIQAKIGLLLVRAMAFEATPN